MSTLAAPAAPAAASRLRHPGLQFLTIGTTGVGADADADVTRAKAVTGVLVVAIDHDRCNKNLVEQRHELLPAVFDYILKLANGRRVVVHSFSNRVSDAFNLHRKSGHRPTNLESIAKFVALANERGHAFEAQDTYLLKDEQVAELFGDEGVRKEYQEKLAPLAAEVVRTGGTQLPDCSTPLPQEIKRLQGSTLLKRRLAQALFEAYDSGQGDCDFLFLDDKLENLKVLPYEREDVKIAWFWPEQIFATGIWKKRGLHLMQWLVEQTPTLERWERLLWDA